MTEAELMAEGELEELDAVLVRVERVLAQKAWDDTVTAVLRAATPSSGGPSHEDRLVNFAVSIADKVAAARAKRRHAGKVPLP